MKFDSQRLFVHGRMLPVPLFFLALGMLTPRFFAQLNAESPERNEVTQLTLREAEEASHILSQYLQTRASSLRYIGELSSLDKPTRQVIYHNPVWEVFVVTDNLRYSSQMSRKPASDKWRSFRIETSQGAVWFNVVRASRNLRSVNLTSRDEKRRMGELLSGVSEYSESFVSSMRDVLD